MLEEMPDGYEPPVSAQEALDTYEQALSAVEQQARTALADAWDKRPQDREELAAWVTSLSLAMDDQWGSLADVAAGDYVTLNRAANGFEPGEVDHSEPLSQEGAERRAQEVVERLDQEGEEAAYSLLERRVAASVMNRARHTVHRSATKAGNGWCRVPERGACWWCLMLASRGAVYTKDTVVTTKKGGRYHAHCRCTPSEVLPGRPLPARSQACVDWYDKHGHLDRDDVESGDFTATTGIPSTSTQARDNRRLGRSKVPEDFTPVLDPAVEPSPDVSVSEHDLDVITHGSSSTRTRADGTERVRYRGGHAHGTGWPGKTEFPASWTEDDIAQAIDLTFSEPHWTHLDGDRRRYRRDVHGVIIEASWYPGPDGEPVITHCYPRSGDGVTYNEADGTVTTRPYDPNDLAPRMET